MSIRALRILPLLSVLLAAQPAQDPAALARKALDLMLAGQYADFFRWPLPMCRRVCRWRNSRKWAP